MKKDMKKKKMMGYKAGGLKMVEKGGKKVPFFAADGKGKMMGGGKVMRYAEGDMIDMGDMVDAGVGSVAGFAPTIKPPKGPMKRRPTAKEREEGFKGMDLPPSERPKKKKKKKKMMGGGMMKYGHGGGVKGGKPRGCGMARQGVRKAKMVVMKGS
jgi:hypothetical protein